VHLLREWVHADEAEVGAHLHPWTTPPFIDEPGFRDNDPSHAFMCELPEDLILAKLETLTTQIEEKIEARPTAFRAGRYGINDPSARILADLGYTVDSSVTPLMSWTTHPGLPHGNGGPDFRSHSARPFIISGTGDPGLLEIPVTIIPTSAILRRFPGLQGLHNSLPVRALSKATGRRILRHQPVWLHPAHFEHTVGDLERVCGLQLKDSGVAVMMVHSSELMPGGSPRTPTQESVEAVLRRLDRFLAFVRSKHVTSMTLSAAAAEVRSRGHLATLSLKQDRS
jgi:hypothetical protein